MKQLSFVVTLIITLQFTGTVNSFGQIPNHSFENWDTVAIGDMLDGGWFSSNFMTPGVVQKTTDAYQGNYAARMQSKIVNGDTAISFIAFGDPGGSEGGMPFSQKPTTLNGHYKYSIAPGDTGLIFIMFKNNGQPMSMDIHKITGTQAAYTPFSIPITFMTPLAIMPDSVVIGISSNNAEMGYADTASYLYIDAISFVGPGVTDTIINGNFENWTDLEYDDPVEWSSLDSKYAMIGENSTIRTTDSYHGNYALLLETVADFEDTIGLIVSGSNIMSGSNGFPYNGTPSVFQGYYKYFPVGNDSALIQCMLYNSTGLSGIGYANFGPASTYTRFELPVFLFSSVVDTASILFVSGMNIGSQLYIDSLSFGSSNIPPSIIPPVNQTICEGTSTGIINFIVNDADNDPLNVFAISDNQALIPDANITLGGTSPNYTIEVMPAVGQTGTATITIYAQDSVSMAIESYSITVLGLPTVVSQSGDTIVCETENVTLAVTATGSGISYQWAKDGYNITGATSATLNLTNLATNDSGAYSCTINGDCQPSTSSNPINVTVEICAGIQDDVSTNMIVEVSPNPFTNSITIQFNETNPIANVELINATGQLIHKKEFKKLTMGTQRALSLKNIDSGVYFLKVSLGEKNYTTRLIKH